jgi:hypothetical protein
VSAVAKAALLDVAYALRDQVEAGLDGDDAIPDLQVAGIRLFNPTPPVVDVYPGDPFAEQTSMGYREQEVAFTVRARVSTAENEGGQELLLQMIDSSSPLSVAAAIYADTTLGGLIGDLRVEGPSGHIVYIDPGGAGNLLGVEWRVVMVR